MKNNIMLSVIFIGIGCYFLFDAFSISLFQNMFSWPTVLCLIGIGFFAQAYTKKEYGHILAGSLFSGIGLYFHFVHYFHVSLNLFELILLFFAIGYFLIFLKTGEGLLSGTLFLAGGLWIIFLQPISTTLDSNGLSINLFKKIWPLLFIVFGVYSLARHKKK